MQSKERNKTKQIHYKVVEKGTLIHGPQQSLVSLAEPARSDSASQQYEVQVQPELQDPHQVIKTNHK